MHNFQVVVGDQDGVVQLFSIRKDEPLIHFKTLPAEKVQCVQLGGAAGWVRFTLYYLHLLNFYLQFN